MRRNLLAIKRDMTVVLGMCLLILAGYFVIPGTPTLDTTNTQQITVQRGDTLWSIAQRVTHDTMDIRHYVYTVKQLNNLANEGDLQPGMVLQVPKLSNHSDKGSTYMAQN